MCDKCRKKIIDYHYWLLEYKLPSLVSNMLFSTGLIHFCSIFFLFIHYTLNFVIFLSMIKKNPIVLKMYCTYIFITLSIHINIKVKAWNMKNHLEQRWTHVFDNLTFHIFAEFFSGVFNRAEISERKPAIFFVYIHLRGNSYTNFILF